MLRYPSRSGQAREATEGMSEKSRLAWPRPTECGGCDEDRPGHCKMCPDTVARSALAGYRQGRAHVWQRVVEILEAECVCGGGRLLRAACHVRAAINKERRTEGAEG
jgi:hypothetical protein